MCDHLQMVKKRIDHEAKRPFKNNRKSTGYETARPFTNNRSSTSHWMCGILQMPVNKNKRVIKPQRPFTNTRKNASREDMRPFTNTSSRTSTGNLTVRQSLQIIE